MFIKNINKFQLWLVFCQRCIDTAIPLGCAISQIFLAFRLVPPPPSIVAVLYDPTIVWVWSLLSFIAYVVIIVGTWIRPHEGKNKNLFGEAYLVFEYPGLIAAAVLTLVYAGALTVKFGLFSSSLVAICFSAAIGFYFLFRWIRLQLLVRIAENPDNVKIEG